ncbi:RNI-like protein [Neoconidiobolus thromboides FSU 785]|nr:RNI-like protein [Neoconidiobolus thromboides FSU 785]
MESSSNNEVAKSKTKHKFSLRWLDLLPLELLMIIFSYLTQKEIYSLGTVCKTWRRNPSHKKRLFYSNGKHYAVYTLSLFLTRARSNLKSICLNNCPKLEYTWFKQLNSFHRPNLNNFEILNSKVTFTFFAPLIRQYKTNLTKITLSNCGLTADIVQEILLRVQNLTHLDISKNELTNNIFYTTDGKLIKSVTTLKHLNVAGLKLKGLFIHTISCLFPNLKEMDISNTTGLEIKIINELCKKYKLITKINLSSMKNGLTRNEQPYFYFRLLALTFQDLTCLNLSKNFFIDSKVIYCLKEVLGNLVDINLTQTFVDITGVKFISSSCSKLKILSIAACPSINDEALLALVNPKSKCKSSLKHLNISRLTFGEQTLHTLLTNLELNYLDLSYCPKVSNHGLSTLLSNSSYPLDYLDLRNCSLISSEFVNLLRKQFKSSTILHCYSY